MTLQVTGKNVDAGGAYKDYIAEKISVVLEKYIGPEISGHARLEKEKTGFRTNCSIRLKTGLLLEAHGEGHDAYSSADAAVERLEKRLRRYKRRLKNHQSGRDTSLPAPERAARDYVVQVDAEESDDDNATHPVIIAETERGIRELSVREAVMHLDLTEDQFLVFRNGGNGELNVVYRRADGNIGWIDPSTSSADDQFNGNASSVGDTAR